jgi:hypothetical protein
MTRLVFGLALLGLAAVAVVAVTRKNNEQPTAEPDAPQPVPLGCPRLVPAAVPLYYAQFSLN